MSSPKTLIAELQRDPRFKATCPACLEDFRLADAVLFAWNDRPPKAALQALQAMRERIKERRRELARSRELMTKTARRTAQAVNLGKIVEKIVPSFASFSYEPGDCRALFEPIDYLVFSGLATQNQVEALFFVDVKSGNARLSRAQTSIKKAVESWCGALRDDSEWKLGHVPINRDCSANCGLMSVLPPKAAKKQAFRSVQSCQKPTYRAIKLSLD
jgi:predicted Holliday junction resolvase-like endonuclease